MLAIPWYRLRILHRYVICGAYDPACMKNRYTYRWLKKAGVYIGSERKEHALAREFIGDNLMVQLPPFSFKLPDGGEELRGAEYGYTPSLTQKIIQLLEQNERSVEKKSELCVLIKSMTFIQEDTLVWHDGIMKCGLSLVVTRGVTCSRSTFKLSTLEDQTLFIIHVCFPALRQMKQSQNYMRLLTGLEQR